MLYEKSRGQYARKDRPGKVKTQINLGLNSEFEKDKEVVVLYLNDFKEIEEQIQTQHVTKAEYMKWVYQ